MKTDRAITICLLHVLREYSDENHILSMQEIRQKMQLLYHIQPDRRTIYSSIALLVDLGYDISTFEDNKIGYYLQSRTFEQSEILLLTDAVYAFPFISNKQSSDLISKLQNQLSLHQRKKYTHLKVIRSNKKSDNREVFLNIEVLDEAIQDKKQVSFSYLKYDINKTLKKRREKPYIVNPYDMVYMNEHYYLICNLSGKQNTSLYRIDHMKDVVIQSSSWDKEYERKDDAMDAVYAFSGKPEAITMRCDNIILDDVIDRFGTNIFIRKTSYTEFEFTVHAPPRGIKFWALQYLQYAEVLSPKWLREQITSSILQNKYITSNTQ